jgi:hypothetical protein
VQVSTPNPLTSISFSLLATMASWLDESFCSPCRGSNPLSSYLTLSCYCMEGCMVE